MDTVFLSGLQFEITIGGYALVLFIFILKMCLKNDSAAVQLPCVFHPIQDEIDSPGRKIPSHPGHLPSQSEKGKQITTDEIQPDGENNRNPQTSQVTFVLVVVIVIIIIATSVMLVFSSFVTTKPIPSITTQHIISNQQATSSPPRGEPMTVVFNPPSPNDAPADIRPAILHGEAILCHTHKTLPTHTGNELDCTNCHFEGGITEKALSLVGVWSVYPKYSEKMKRPIDLAMKTNACFMRYLNAGPLAPDGNDMLDILAYYQWISKDIPVDANVPWLGLQPIKIRQKPDVEQGKKVFGKCMPCHGQNGQGLLPSDGPPLWGKGAFPKGGGMGQTDTLAAFVHKLMPKNNPDLSVNQAADVAAFVLSHPQPQQKQQ